MHRHGRFLKNMGKKHSVAERSGSAVLLAGQSQQARIMRPDLYPNPSDALPLGVRVEIPAPHQEAAPVRALACATQSVRLTADRREGPRRADRVDAPQPNQLPLAIEAGERYWEAE